MAVELADRPKRSAALCTGERPLARVLSHVIGEVTPLRKGPDAHPALVRTRPPAGVREHVRGETPFRLKRPLAKIARERPHAAVHPQVFDELAGAREPLPAHVTVVQPRPLLILLASMHVGHVYGEMGLLLEGLVADDARERPLASVHRHVPDERARRMRRGGDEGGC